MGEYKLLACKECDLEGKFLYLMKHIEPGENGVCPRYYVLCGCKKRVLFDSEKEAAEAWNKANSY